MDSFWKINKGKVFGVFLSSTKVLFFLLLVILVAYYFFGKSMPISSLVIMLILLPPALSIYTTIWQSCVWLLDARHRKKAFTVFPFNEIEKLGARKGYIGANDKSSFTEEVWLLEINGFTIICDAKRRDKNIMEFIISINDRDLERSERERLVKEFEIVGAYLDYNEVIKDFNLKDVRLHSITQLQQQLEQITALLKNEGFVPYDIDVK